MGESRELTRLHRGAPDTLGPVWGVNNKNRKATFANQPRPSTALPTAVIHLGRI